MDDKIKLNTSSSAITLDPADIQKASEWEEFVSLWMTSQEIDVANQWYKGDLANRVAVIHGDSSLIKFAEEVKESKQIMEHYRRTARAFPKSEMRNWNLSWTHYLISSYADSFNKSTKLFESDNRFKWLEDAHDNGWSTGRLQTEIKKSKTVLDKGDLFQYYFDYVVKFRNIMMHVEKDVLTDNEKDQLIHKLLDTYNEFMVYLKEK